MKNGKALRSTESAEWMNQYSQSQGEKLGVIASILILISPQSILWNAEDIFVY